jgi:hypothetical protein
MTKKGSRSKKPKRSSFLKSLYGGDGETSGEKPVETNAEKPSAFSGILNKLSTSLSGSPTRSGSGSTKPGEDYYATNSEDKTNDVSFPISFSSSKSKSDSSASPDSGSSETKDSPSSTTWFIFRVVIVLLLVLSFGLYFTGYLDKLTAWYTNAMGPYITPLLVSIGLMNSTPTTDIKTNGQKSATGTNSITQLDQNVGIAPVSTATPIPAPPRQSQPPSQPPSKPPSQPPSKPSQYKIDNIKPIPIQPNQRQTPLQNIGDSARPPSTQPAKYQEEQSREQAKLNTTSFRICPKKSTETSY